MRRNEMGLIIANSTPLIALAKIGKIDLLEEIYARIVIPEAVYEEVAISGKGKKGNVEITKAEWVIVKEVRDKKLKKFLQLELGEGEAEVIALACEANADLVIIDENRGRRIARMFGLKVSGTIGTIIEAKRKGLLNNVREVLDELINADVWIGEDLYEEALKLCGEYSGGDMT